MNLEEIDAKSVIGLQIRRRYLCGETRQASSLQIRLIVTLPRKSDALSTCAECFRGAWWRYCACLDDASIHKAGTQTYLKSMRGVDFVLSVAKQNLVHRSWSFRMTISLKLQWWAKKCWPKEILFGPWNVDLDSGPRFWNQMNHLAWHMLSTWCPKKGLMHCRNVFCYHSQNSLNSAGRWSPVIFTQKKQPRRFSWAFKAESKHWVFRTDGAGLVMIGKVSCRKVQSLTLASLCLDNRRSRLHGGQTRGDVIHLGWGWFEAE